MDEEISEINASTRNEKIKNFFNNNKKKIISVLTIIILLAFSYFAYDEIIKRNKIKISDQYNSSKINYLSGYKSNVENEMIQIIQKKDKTYIFKTIQSIFKRNKLYSRISFDVNASIIKKY